MAEFSRLIITKKGQALLAKAMLGECGVEFTKVSISSSEYGEEELEGLAELSGVRQTAPVSNVSRISGTEVSVAAEADNAGLAEGYYVRAVGLHAADPAGGEALCAVAVETSGNCHMPAYKGKTVSGIYIKLNMAVGNPENVSLEVSPAAVATIGDIKELRRELAAHAEFAGRYLGGDSGGRPAFAEGIQADDLVGAVNEVFDAIPAVTRSAAVTQEGKALDAVEKNAAVEGTLANQIGQINSNINNITTVTHGYFSIPNTPAWTGGLITIYQNAPAGGYVFAGCVGAYADDTSFIINPFPVAFGEFRGGVYVRYYNASAINRSSAGYAAFLWHKIST